MKSTLFFIALCLLALGCSKRNNNTTPVSTLQSTASEIGLIWGHPYKFIQGDTNDVITFYQSDSMKEMDRNVDAMGNPIGICDTLTFSVVYFHSISYSTSLLKDGAGLAVVLTGLNQITSFSTKCGYYSGDTILIGTYLSGNIIQSGNPTLGFENLESTNSGYGQLIY